MEPVPVFGGARGWRNFSEGSAEDGAALVERRTFPAVGVVSAEA